MNAKQLHLYVFLILAALATWLFGKILWPYVTVIAIALVLAVLAYPLYQYFEKKLPWRGLASIVTLLLVVIVILGPLVFFGALVVEEAFALVAELREGGGGVSSAIASIELALQSVVPTATFSVEQMAQQGFSLLADNLTGNAGDNVLAGVDGDDILSGGDGNDTLYGDGAIDVFGARIGDIGERFPRRGRDDRPHVLAGGGDVEGEGVVAGREIFQVLRQRADVLAERVELHCDLILGHRVARVALGDVDALRVLR